MIKDRKDPEYVPLDERYQMLWSMHRLSERWVGLQEVATSLGKPRVFEAVRRLIESNEPHGHDELIADAIIGDWHLFAEAVRDMMGKRNRKLYMAMNLTEFVYRSGSPAGYIWTWIRGGPSGTRTGEA
jgi:hypothetical protein